jgi:hypothetical protein
VFRSEEKIRQTGGKSAEVMENQENGDFSAEEWAVEPKGFLAKACPNA